MTAAYEHMNFRELVGLLTEEEQEDLRPVVLRLVASHGRLVETKSEATPARRRLSFEGIAEAAPDFAATSQEVLWRELGGRE
ncbi:MULTISPECIES: hypothetical protein [unclassified Nocardia]|uniref:hypothetical protein n=1 Tax=unclassified Nocardia TaxID=2637762 RepID=UPI001CE45339|nr:MULTISPECIES: hypothetical protein [unclassified Nocardia]